jgi:DNA-binding transcriptional regulator GbsR (MarR family)
MSLDKQLVDIVVVLVERFGAGCTLGQVHATTYFLKEKKEGKNPKIMDLVEVTGCSKQNISRWLQHSLEIGTTKTRFDDEDARKLEINITNPERAYRHLEPLSEILG